MKIIGLVGKAGAGKTTIAKHLEQHHGFKRMAFADPLKQMLIKAGMCTHDECYVQKTEMSRWLLQKIGTDIFRMQVNPRFWIDLAIEEACRIMDSIGDDAVKIVFDDVRFTEEAEAILSDLGGILVKVERMGHVDATAGTEHASESQVDKIRYNRIIRAESGDTQKLILCIEEILGERP